MSQYERKATYPVSQIHELFEQTKTKRADLDGDSINVRSLRYRVFRKNTECVTCGLVGSMYAKERDKGSTGGYHLNLYAVNEHGHEVLMTKDHIQPKAKGGSDHIDNLQTMCTKCNGKKADNW